MGKAKEHRRGKFLQVYDRPHPDGGTWGLRPRNGVEAVESAENTMRDELMMHEGRVIYNQVTGLPVTKSKRSVKELFADARKHVAYIRDLIDGEATTDPEHPVFFDTDAQPAIIDEMLYDFRVKDVTVQQYDDAGRPVFDADGKPTYEQKPVLVPNFYWVLEEIEELTKEVAGAATKNSSPTPAGS